MSNKIIKPHGPTMKRIHIDIDATGQAVVEGENLTFNGKPIPMHPLEMASLLSQIVAQSLAFYRGMGNEKKSETESGDRVS